MSATVRYYNSATTLGGAKGVEIASGAINEVFPEITIADRLAGADLYRMFYFDAEPDSTLFLGLYNNGNYKTTLYSGVVDEVLADLLARTPDVFKNSPISSNTINTLTLEFADTEEFNSWDAGGVANVDSGIFTITPGATDNLDGTLTVSVTPDMSGNDLTGEDCIKVRQETMTSGVAIAFWLRVQVPASTPYTAPYNTIETIVLE